MKSKDKPNVEKKKDKKIILWEVNSFPLQATLSLGLVKIFWIPEVNGNEAQSHNSTKKKRKVAAACSL